MGERVCSCASFKRESVCNRESERERERERERGLRLCGTIFKPKAILRLSGQFFSKHARTSIGQKVLFSSSSPEFFFQIKKPKIVALVAKRHSHALELSPIICYYHVSAVKFMHFCDFSKKHIPQIN